MATWELKGKVALVTGAGSGMFSASGVFIFFFFFYYQSAC